MNLYRASPKDGVAWITGASSGIGRALALKLAQEGYTVAATARTLSKLESLRDEASGLQGHIVLFPGDATDAGAMEEMVSVIGRQCGPIALAVFCAGTYAPMPGEALKASRFTETWNINVNGVLNGLIPVVEAMKKTGRGQIAIVSSVAGYCGLPQASAYALTKAGLIAMAQALKFDFDRMNIRLQIVNPGFVDTPLTQKNDYAMPGMITVEAAAGQFAQGLRTGGFEITFPRWFAFVMKGLSILPSWLYFPLIARQTGWSRREKLVFKDRATAPGE